MINNILGKRILSLRESKKISQLELAKLLNISNTTLSQYESGKRIPNDEIKKNIAIYFNVSIDYLLGLTDIKEPINEIIKKGEVAIKPPSEIEKIYESLPAEEKKMLEDYGDYLETRAKLTDRNKENSSTSKGLKDKRAE